jgi:tRNA(Ile)-lysidine synthase
MLKEPFIIALSGGIDSMALVHMCRLEKRDFIAITVNHNLRDDSLEEAQSVAKYMKSFGVRHEVLHINEKPVKNIQVFARRVRYKLLCDRAKELGIGVIFTAHNKDDVAETLLMRLNRGSGLKGLSAIAGDTKINGVAIHRPLLNKSKAELKQFLLDNNFIWFEDSSNASSKYSRNRLRSAMIQYGVDINNIAMAASNLRNANDLVEQVVARQIELVKTPDGNYDLSKLEYDSEEIRIRIAAFFGDRLSE